MTASPSLGLPRSTAAASGIGAIARGFAYGAPAGAAILFFAYVVVYARAKKGERGESVGFFSAPLLIPFLLLALAAGLVLLLLDLFSSEGTGYGLLSNLRVVAVIVLLVGLLAVYPTIVGTGDENGSLRSLSRFYPRPVYRAIVASVLIVTMFASVLLPGEASLSCLWKEDPKGEVFEADAVGTQSQSEPLQWTLQGGFLSRSDGAWYVLTEANRLQAISDDESARVVGGDFSVRYLEIGREGRPAGEPVPEEDMKSWGTYVAVKHCSGFPSQPTIIRQGGITISQSSSWVRQPTQGE